MAVSGAAIVVLLAARPVVTKLERVSSPHKIEDIPPMVVRLGVVLLDSRKGISGADSGYRYPGYGEVAVRLCVTKRPIETKFRFIQQLRRKHVSFIALHRLGGNGVGGSVGGASR